VVLPEQVVLKDVCFIFRGSTAQLKRWEVSEVLTAGLARFWDTKIWSL
jgi:hypothetical protein